MRTNDIDLKQVAAVQSLAASQFVKGIRQMLRQDFYLLSEVYGLFEMYTLQREF